MELFRSAIKHTARDAVITALAFVFLGIWFYYSLGAYNADTARSTLVSEADRLAGSMEARLEEQLPLLFGAQGLFYASESVERDEWRRYFEGFISNDLFEGISTIVFIEIVSEEDKDKFTENTRADTSVSELGYLDFNIYPDEDKNEYFVAKYIEPYEGRESSLGFDVGSDPVRLEAITKSRDSGQIVLSGVFPSIVTGDNSFALILPVYDDESSDIYGFVYGVFRAPLFIKDVLESYDLPGQSGVSFELYEEENYETPFYSFIPENSESPEKSRALKETRQIDFSGARWTAEFYAPASLGLTSLQNNGGTLAFFSAIFAGTIASAFVYLLRLKWEKEQEDLIRARELEGQVQKYAKTLEKEVTNQTKDLRAKVEELERLNKVMVGRELKMVELKKEVEQLKTGQIKTK